MPATVEFEGLTEFRRALKLYAPEVAREFNKEARAVAGGIATSAKSNAGWSRRIPRSIKPTVTTRIVGVRVSKAAAPHGPLYERGGGGGSSTFRHPLFGNRAFYYTQQTRPFLKPAVDAGEDEASLAMQRAVENARGKVGLHG